MGLFLRPSGRTGLALVSSLLSCIASACPAATEVSSPFGEGLDSETNTAPSYNVLSTSATTASNVPPDHISDLFSGKAYLLSAHATEPADSRDREWAVMSASTSFPNATGERPLGMSLEAYACMLLNRWPLVWARDVKLISNFADLIIIKAVNAITAVRLRSNNRLLRDIARVTAADVQQFHDLLSFAGSMQAKRERFDNASACVKALFDAVRYCGNVVPGTPAFLNSFRCKVFALWDRFGAPGIFFTINPGELHVQLFCQLAGHPYGFHSDTGMPDARRQSAANVWKLLSRNPAAADQFFHAYMQAFVEVVFGWDTTAAAQRPGAEDTCLLGKVLAWYYNVETSTRLSEHAHGQVRMRSSNFDQRSHETLQRAL